MGFYNFNYQIVRVLIYRNLKYIYYFKIHVLTSFATLRSHLFGKVFGRLFGIISRQSCPLQIDILVSSFFKYMLLNYFYLWCWIGVRTDILVLFLVSGGQHSVSPLSMIFNCRCFAVALIKLLKFPLYSLFAVFFVFTHEWMLFIECLFYICSRLLILLEWTLVVYPLKTLFRSF